MTHVHIGSLHKHLGGIRMAASSDLRRAAETLMRQSICEIYNDLAPSVVKNWPHPIFAEDLTRVWEGVV